MLKSSPLPGQPSPQDADCHVLQRINVQGKPSSTPGPITRQAIKVACSNCNLRELCMPLGLSAEELGRLDAVVSTRRKVRRGGTLFRNGEAFTNLYAIRTGFFKTCVASEGGRDQVTGFQMAGEVMGLDGIVNDRHTCDAVALEDAEVCVMPFDRIEELSREITGLQRHVHKILSREIVRENDVMLLLGSMRAEARIAAFVLNLAQRHIRILKIDALRDIVNTDSACN